MPTQKDEQIEFWLNQMGEILKDRSRTEQQIERGLDDLEERIKDRLEVPDLDFADEYIEDVIIRLTDLRGTDSLPN
jgi:dsDNA-specific endonuclease/ATPase MutS2